MTTARTVASMLFATIGARRRSEPAKRNDRYPRYSGALPSDELYALEFEHLVRLRTPASYTYSEPSVVLGIKHARTYNLLRNLGHGYDDDEGDGEHKRRLLDSVISPLLHDYHGLCDTHLHAQKYLPLAPKLLKLGVLQRSKAMPDSHLENMILFIQQIRNAFPRIPHVLGSSIPDPVLHARCDGCICEFPSHLPYP